MFIKREASAPKSATQLETELQSLAAQSQVGSIAQRVIQEMKHCTFGIRPQKGEADISRKTTRLLFPHLVVCVMALPTREQQIYLRGILGTRIALDHSYNSVASLTGAIEHALSKAGARKPGSFHASVATATGEGGYAFCAIIAPNDSHDVILAVLCGLLGAQLPGDVSEHDTHSNMVRDDVAADGTLSNFPVATVTDNSNSEMNL